MPIVPNRTKEKLAAGELALGMGLRMARTADIAKVAKVAGYDWLFVDMEHSPFSIDTAAQLCCAALDAGITPVPRVPGHQHFHASRILDGGAQGVVVPHVSTVAEAKAVVDACRYPPVGHRSVAGAMAILEYEPTPIGKAARLMNENILVVVMIESPEGVANADAIAALDGIDGLLIGTNDLCAEMGIPGEFGHDRVRDAYDKVISACRNNGKYPGMGGIYDEVLAPRYIGMGAQMILSGNDMSFMMAGAKARSSYLRGLK